MKKTSSIFHGRGTWTWAAHSHSLVGLTSLLQEGRLNAISVTRLCVPLLESELV